MGGHPEPTLTAPRDPAWTLGCGAVVGEDGQVTPSASRPPLRRPLQGRRIAGVCAGLAGHLGVHPTAVRAVFVLAGLMGGLGIVVYGFLWALVEQEPGGQDAAGSRRRGPSAEAWLLLAGGALVLLAGAVALEQRGLDLRLDRVVPAVVVAAGAAFAWSQLDDTVRRRWVPGEGPQRTQALLRLGAGVALAVLGLVVLSAQGSGVAVGSVVFSVLVVLAGVVLIATPYLLRLWRDLQAEQAERVRATERADIAAHLHDSVLQTLALIQRRAEDPGTVVRLARAQERELRDWLYGAEPGRDETLASAVAQVGAEVEDALGVALDVVVTGDRPLDDRVRALVAALREALLNATRHGSPPVTAYVEVGPDAVEAFVRDHGPGFDPDAVPADRLGVRESILGRMARHGGRAAVRRLETGTEVSLVLPLQQPGVAPQEPGPAAAEPAAADPSPEPSAAEPTVHQPQEDRA